MKKLEIMYLEALEYSTSGEISKAQRMAEQILEKDSDFGKAHYLLGWINFEYENDLEKAREHAKIAIKNAPNDPLGYYLYCDILIAEQNLEEMKYVIEGIIKLNVIDKAYIYHKLAYIYEARRQYMNALDTLHKSKDHSNTLSWNNFLDNEILRVRRKIRAA